MTYRRVSNIAFERDKPSSAIHFLQKTEKSLSRLKKFPRSGRPIPEFPELPFREVIANRYRFFYKVKNDNDKIWIVAEWHGK